MGNTRMRMAWVAVVAGMATAGCGLGNWSNEDFLFARAVPRRDLVELRVPGVAGDVAGVAALTQGLNDSCANTAERDALTCLTRDVAAMFNGATFALVDLVSTIASREPTRRAQGMRVWGPHFQPGANRTFRFEMRRDDDVGQGGFRYCLHVAAGQKVGFRADAGVGCGRDAGGFVEVFRGTYVPEEGVNDPRQAVGTMELDLARQNEAGLNDPADPTADGRFRFAYDTTGDQQTIQIEIDRIQNSATGLPQTGTYSYHRMNTGAGLMHLAVINAMDLDQLVLDARWNAEGAGRVDGTGTTGGPFAGAYRGWECTNADLQIVARHLEWAPERDLPAGSPDEGLCPVGLPPPRT